MKQDAGKDVSFRHQITVLRRRLPAILLVAALAGGTAAWFTARRAPVYEATSSILLQPVRSLNASTGVRQTVASPNETATEIEVMLSQVVQGAVREKLGHDVKVKVKARGATSVIDIRARSANPKVAASDATTFGEVYIGQRRSQRVSELQAAGVLVQNQLADLEGQLGNLLMPLREAEDRLNATADPKVRPQLQSARDTVADSISAQRRNLERRKSELEDELNQFEVARRLDPAGGVQLLSSATEPTSPISASAARNGAVGLVGGLVLGIALAFLFEQLDDRLRRKDELEEAVKRPVLGLLPLVARRYHRDGPLALQSPNSPTAEAYRTLRTSLQFMGIERPITCIHVTSATSGEGKTTVVTNLAASFAQAGHRVIVLDCDLRRPKVHEVFGSSNDNGLTSVLLGELSLAAAITILEGEPYLSALTSGPVPPNPSELLGSEQARAIISTLRDNCDILLIDSPPVLPVTDALVVSRYVDATLLVARPKLSTKRQLSRAQELLSQVGAPLVGTLLNGVVHESGEGYGFGYGGYAALETTVGEGRRRSKSTAGGETTGRPRGGVTGPDPAVEPTVADRSPVLGVNGDVAAASDGPAVLSGDGGPTDHQGGVHQ